MKIKIDNNFNYFIGLRYCTLGKMCNNITWFSKGAAPYTHVLLPPCELCYYVYLLALPSLRCSATLSIISCDTIGHTMSFFSGGMHFLHFLYISTRLVAHIPGASSVSNYASFTSSFLASLLMPLFPIFRSLWLQCTESPTIAVSSPSKVHLLPLPGHWKCGSPW